MTRLTRKPSRAKRPGPAAQAFLASLGSRVALLRDQSKAARGLVKEVVADLQVPIHDVTARPKDQGSATEKIIKKGYGQPARQMTDLVGVRVVTYYADDVDMVVARLKASLEIHPDAKKSPDKRVDLDVREFGYRSVHLVMRATSGQLVRYRALRNRWIEIQVRSILEHSWAEIEHDVVYKSGIARDDQITRRFSSMAAVLEIVNQGFEGLRDARRELAASYSREYAAGRDFDKSLDAARLSALMDVLQPSQPGWHDGPESPGTAPHMASRIVEALRFAGLNTGSDVSAALGTSTAAEDAAEYATAAGTAVTSVSHVVHLLLILGRQDSSLVDDCFPAECTDPALRTALGI